MDASSEYGRVHGYFVEPDERAVPLLHAIGRVVWAAAALEKVLLLEIARLQYERDGVFPREVELAKLELARAGRLLKQLRDLRPRVSARSDALGRASPTRVARGLGAISLATA